jgi:hypothetical protein
MTYRTGPVDCHRWICPLRRRAATGGIASFIFPWGQGSKLAENEAGCSIGKSEGQEIANQDPLPATFLPPPGR